MMYKDLGAGQAMFATPRLYMLNTMWQPSFLRRQRAVSNLLKFRRLRSDHVTSQRASPLSSHAGAGYVNDK